jgi:DNA-binding PadR family transcriptional regulator
MKTEDLEFHVLSCLAAARDGKHGYAVRRTLLERLGMTVPLPSIYRLIDRLHQKRLVECQEGAFADSYAGMPRKTFRLTEAGWHYLADRALSVRTQIDRLLLSLDEYKKVVSHAEKRETQGG